MTIAIKDRLRVDNQRLRETIMGNSLLNDLAREALEARIAALAANDAERAVSCLAAGTQFYQVSASALYYGGDWDELGVTPDAFYTYLKQELVDQANALRANNALIRVRRGRCRVVVTEDRTGHSCTMRLTLQSI